VYLAKYKENGRDGRDVELYFAEPMVLASQLLTKIGTNSTFHHVVINSLYGDVWWSRGLNDYDTVDLREIDHFYIAPTTK
jgi:hypothetical protein